MEVGKRSGQDAVIRRCWSWRLGEWGFRCRSGLLGSTWRVSAPSSEPPVLAGAATTSGQASLGIADAQAADAVAEGHHLAAAALNLGDDDLAAKVGLRHVEREDAVDLDAILRRNVRRADASRGRSPARPPADR